MRDDLVVADQGGVVESLERADDLIADPLPQLLARGAAERDEQHLVERRGALGDIARHQPRQRERLAGAGAGLQHGGRLLGGQRAHQVEAVHHTGLSARSIGSHTRSEYESRPAATRSSKRQPCPHARTCAGAWSSAG